MRWIGVLARCGRFAGLGLRAGGRWLGPLTRLARLVDRMGRVGLARREGLAGSAGLDVAGLAGRSAGLGVAGLAGDSVVGRRGEDVAVIAVCGCSGSRVGCLAVVAPQQLAVGGEGGAQDGGVVGFEKPGDADEPIGFVEQPDAAPFPVVIRPVRVVAVGRPPVRSHNPGQLAHRHLPGQIQPLGLGLRFGHVGDQAQLGPAQLAGSRGGADRRQRLELAAHPGLLGSGAQIDAQVDRRPVAQRADAHTMPTVDGVELCEQSQQLGVGGVDLAYQLAQPGRELIDLGRHDERSRSGFDGERRLGHVPTLAN
jgi:hypothetical protein